MHRHRLPLVAAVLLPAFPLFAQAEPARFTNRAVDLDSGYLTNAGAQAQELAVGTVRVAQAAWLRLHFAQTNLPAGTRLRLQAQRDQAVQWFDAGSLADYRDGSAYFNGDAVEVRVILPARTTGCRVRVVSADCGEPAQIGIGPSSICGPTDDRQLSSDPRQGRQFPTGCSSWLVNEFTVLTAGHCTGTTVQQIHFNVPLSNSSGGTILPPPEDQYPYDLATQQRLSGGVGQDWTVVTTVRNSNTRMYPGQRQGAWYELGAVPGSPTGQNIRITGYGTVSAPVSPTWNQVQKTHLGPMVAQSATYPTAIGYVTDSTGGNSGSPIIHENTGKAIGIHTHGGCSSTGGNNWGTRIDRPDIQSSVASRLLLKSAGKWSTFGNSCPGSTGAPGLAGSGYPDLGFTPKAMVSAARPNQAGVLFFGASNTQWGSIVLPFDLGGVGMPGCKQYVSLDVSVPLATGVAGSPSYSFPVPNDPALRGGRFHLQYVFADAGANALGLVATNGLTGLVGD